MDRDTIKKRLEVKDKPSLRDASDSFQTLKYSAKVLKKLEKEGKRGKKWEKVDKGGV
jgi:hypothetical protein